MMGLLGPIIKAGFIGGGSVACVYGVYKLAIDISKTDLDGGVDLFTNMTKLQSKSMDLKTMSSAIQALNNTQITTYLKSNSEKVVKIMSDPRQSEVAIKVFEGCSNPKNKEKITCKDVGTAFDTIAEKLSKDAEQTDSSPFTSWLAGDPVKLLKNFKEASPDKLIEYLEGVETIKSFQKKGVPEMLTKPMTAIYSWFTFMQQKPTVPAPVNVVP